MSLEMAYNSISSSSSSSSSSSYDIASETDNAITLPRKLAAHEAKKRKAGRKKFRETRHPVYRGVRQRNGNKWVCEVREPSKRSRLWLGTFGNPELAARAHDVAALALRGDMASLNFPDSAWLLPRAKSSSATDIKMAALAVAAASSCPSSSLNGANTSPTKEVRRTPPAIQEKGMMVSEHSSAFFDEEALFNLPGLLESMAEGLLMTPPLVGVGYDDWPADMDFTLWRHS